MPKRFISAIPGLRVAPQSTLLLPPAARKATLWPSSAELGTQHACPVGPVVRLHLRPEPLHLLKAAVQRLVSNQLRGCTPPAEVAKPFPHHWELTVHYEANIPLHERKLEHETYALHATQGKLTHVHLRAASQWGALLGLQTLSMLLEITHSETTIHAAAHLPSTPFSEGPHLLHRAIRIPSTFDVSEIRHAIDHGAQLKFNVLHWDVLADGRLVLPFEMVRMVVQYAYLRGLQVMFELVDWGTQAKAQENFLRVFMPLSTSPLLHVGAHPPTVPADMPHQLVQTQRAADTVHEAKLGHGEQPGDLVRVPSPQTEAAFEQLATIDLPGIRGAALELPANLLAQLQVAALLWAPESRARVHHDPRLAAAIAAIWGDGVGTQHDHAMDLEALRFLAKADDTADGGLV